MAGSLAALGIAAMGVASCGGGGSSPAPTPAPPPPPQGQAPVFNGSSNIATGENAVPIVDLDFSDPDGDTVTYSLGTASDNGFVFVDETSGKLRFRTPPDFEFPEDTNQDNIFDVDVVATDSSGLSTIQPLSITVEDRTGDADRRYVHYTLRNSFLSANIPFGLPPGASSGEELLMDIYLPANDDIDRRAVMLFAFGGGFVTGDRQSVDGLAKDFARRGYVTATIDYRTIDTAPGSELEYLQGAANAIQDVSAAVRYFREDGLGDNLFGVDPELIFVAGESAGGVIAATLATLEIDDLADGEPIKDYLIQTGGIAGRSSDNFDSVDSDIQGALLYSGGTLRLDFIDSESEPLYAAHDEFDPVVPCETGPEGSQDSGVVLSGGCDITERYAQLGLSTGLFFVPNSDGHVDFDPVQLDEIAQEAGRLFLEIID